MIIGINRGGFYMEIKDRKCRLEEGEASNPKTICAGERFKRDAPDFNRVWSGWGLYCIDDYRG